MRWCVRHKILLFVFLCTGSLIAVILMYVNNVNINKDWYIGLFLFVSLFVMSSLTCLFIELRFPNETSNRVHTIRVSPPPVHVISPICEYVVDVGIDETIVIGKNTSDTVVVIQP
jgi:hypothetical protein